MTRQVVLATNLNIFVLQPVLFYNKFSNNFYQKQVVPWDRHADVILSSDGKILKIYYEKNTLQEKKIYRLVVQNKIFETKI